MVFTPKGASMVDWSLIVAVLVVALFGGAITGAVSLALGGLGVTRQLNKRMGDLEVANERTDDRVTREVKTRAGQAAVAKRTDADVKQEAALLLATKSPARTTARPSVINMGGNG